MGKIAKFDVMNASNKVTDMYDNDNFYPFSGLDTDGEGLDIEFSEALGDNFKKIFSKGGVKGLVNKRRAGLDERLDARNKRILARNESKAAREERRKLKADARLKRRNLKQVEKFEELPPVVEETVEKIVEKNKSAKAPIEKTKEGLGNEKDERIADTVIDVAKDLVDKGSTDIPTLPIDVDGQIKTSWWGTKSTGVKVAIIGGGFLVLGAITYFIVKSKK